MGFIINMWFNCIVSDIFGAKLQTDWEKLGKEDIFPGKKLPLLQIKTMKEKINIASNISTKS
jgi:hypothetical protein